uniref:Uncharacterized protein n=1 Tax=Kalanchoe fedtschenkoi TaxID=63787 RepID=A0A7N0RII6_KALFE
MPAMSTHPLPDHRLVKACQEIRNSEDPLCHLLHSPATHSLTQRLALIQTYNQMYGEDLITHLATKSKLSPDLPYAVTLWLTDPHTRDALVVWQSLGIGVDCGADYKALVEIFVGRKSSHVLMIKQAYAARFWRNLEQDIISIEPPSPFQKILVALAASHKALHVEASQHVAKCDAKRLFDTMEGKPGGSAVDEAVVLEIFCKRSIPQLKLTFSRYRQIYGHHYTKMLMKKNSREFEDALKIVIDCMCNAPRYYAKLFHAIIDGSARSGSTLARVVVGRAEVDMGEIQREYADKYGTTLLEAIYRRMPCGEFKDFIVALISRTKINA